MISQGSLKLSLILKLLFAFCYSDWLMSASLFSRSLIHSFVLANWLSIPSNVFFFKFQLLYISGLGFSFQLSVDSLLKFLYSIIKFLRVLMTISLNTLSGKFLISISLGVFSLGIFLIPSLER